MAYDVATTAILEDALAEGFNYHNELDSFLSRAGVDQVTLRAARRQADEKAELSTREYSRAPKRFVAQEVLSLLAEAGEGGQRTLAAIVTGLCKGRYPNASPAGQEAISRLVDAMASEKADREAAKKAAENSIQAREKAARQELERQKAELRATREKLRERFQALASEANTQSRGYLLEQFMNGFFEFEGLDPRRSFRLEAEQIDGSMMWRDRSNLVEVKWTKAPVSGSDFGAFVFKLEGKSADTRGLFLSINGYSAGAVAALNGKGALKFVCLDGAHIMRALSPEHSLRDILAKIWRHADETGEAFLPVSKM